MHAHEPEVDDFPGHIPDLHTIADAHAVLADQEEVADDGHEHALHGDRHSGREQAGKGRKRAQFGDEGESDDGDDQRPDGDLAKQQMLVASTRLVRVSQHGAAPHFSAREHDGEQRCKNAESNAQSGQAVVVLTPDGVAPVSQVVAILVEQHAFLAQRNEDRGGLLEQPGQGIELIPHTFQCGAGGGVRLGRKGIAAGRQRLQSFQRRRADLEEGLFQVGRAAVDRLDRADLLREPERIAREVPDSHSAAHAAARRAQGAEGSCGG